MNIPVQLADYIDHTLLKADATAKAIEQLCFEAVEHRFHSVCVNGTWVSLARSLTRNSGVKVAAVAGFPLGAGSSIIRAAEVAQTVADGADEIDVVIQVGRLKGNNHPEVLGDLRGMVKAADGRPVKVILETCLLTREEKLAGCAIAMEAGASFVKTSTGFSSGGATFDDVRLMRQAVGPALGVKASGGIRDSATALAMIQAGANRLGTSSGIAIVQGNWPQPGNGY